jgi:hypothetical protein
VRGEAYPALFTMMWIFPFPNSAVFFTRTLRYSASSMSPGTEMAFPPDLLMSSATFAAFAALESALGMRLEILIPTSINV